MLLCFFHFCTFPLFFKLCLSLLLEQLDLLHDLFSDFLFCLLRCIEWSFRCLDLLAVYNLFLKYGLLYLIYVCTFFDLFICWIVTYQGRYISNNSLELWKFSNISRCSAGSRGCCLRHYWRPVSIASSEKFAYDRLGLHVRQTANLLADGCAWDRVPIIRWCWSRCSELWAGVWSFVRRTTTTACRRTGRSWTFSQHERYEVIDSLSVPAAACLMPSTKFRTVDCPSRNAISLPTTNGTDSSGSQGWPGVLLERVEALRVFVFSSLALPSVSP